MYKVATFADYTKFKAILAFTIHKTLFTIFFSPCVVVQHFANNNCEISPLFSPNKDQSWQVNITSVLGVWLNFNAGIKEVVKCVEW